MRNGRGYALVITIMIICALFFFTIQYVRLFAAEKAIAGSGERALIAHAAASAGIDDAIANLKQNVAWSAGFDTISLPHSGATYSMSFNTAQAAVPYSTNNSAGAASVNGYGGRVVPAGMIHLVSAGRYEKAVVLEECMVSSGPSKLFHGAVFVKETIFLNGNAETDSFNSAVKPYAQQHFDYGGDVGTNMAEAPGGGPAVRLVGNSNIQGALTVGPNGTKETSVSGQQYQDFAVLKEPFRVPLLPCTPASNPQPVTVKNNATKVLTPGTYSSVKGTGGVLRLQEGTYIITGDLSLSGKCILDIPAGTGKVEIYVQGSSIDMTGGCTNSTLRPRNLIIYGGESTTSVKLAGQAEQYFGLYAPNAEIDVKGGAAIYGALTGRSLRLVGNGAFHYDSDMEALGGSGGAPMVKARW